MYRCRCGKYTDYGLLCVRCSAGDEPVLTAEDMDVDLDDYLTCERFLEDDGR